MLSCLFRINTDLSVLYTTNKVNIHVSAYTQCNCFVFPCCLDRILRKPGTDDDLRAFHQEDLPVTHVEHWERPISGFATTFGAFRHQGTVVTAENGQRLLIDKVRKNKMTR